MSIKRLLLKYGLIATYPKYIQSSTPLTKTSMNPNLFTSFLKSANHWSTTAQLMKSSVTFSKVVVFRIIKLLKDKVRISFASIPNLESLRILRQRNKPSLVLIFSPLIKQLSILKHIWASTNLLWRGKWKASEISLGFSKKSNIMIHRVRKINLIRNKNRWRNC